MANEKALFHINHAIFLHFITEATTNADVAHGGLTTIGLMER